MMDMIDSLEGDPFIDEFLAALLALEQELADERGGFVLFALVLRREMIGVVPTSDPGLTERWDLLLAATWLDDSKRSLDYIVGKIRRSPALGAKALLGISQIVVLAPVDDVVRRINRTVQTEHEPKRLTSQMLGTVEIAGGCVITSRPPGVRVTA
jgi:hypothetical protein